MVAERYAYSRCDGCTYDIIPNNGGTYTVQVNDQCHNATSLPVSFTQDVCTACVALPGNGNYTQLGGNGTIVQSDLTGGPYYITNINATISGVVSMSNETVFMGPGVTLNVPDNSKLTLDHCHLFGCNQMWKGIKLPISSGWNGVLVLTNSTLIEDAINAVSIPNVAQPYTGNKILTSNGTIFNRNWTGINIANAVSQTAGTYFDIQNSIFTSRNFSGTSGYPYNWPTTTILKANNFVNYFEAPYGINNNGLYPIVDCKDNHIAEHGVKLMSVGTYTGTTTLTYYEIQIGQVSTGGVAEMNIFDNLRYGIYAENSNFASVNNTFMKMKHSTNVGGDGIYAKPTSGYYATNRARIYEPGSNTIGNRFYSFVRAVEIEGYRDVTGKKSYMISDQSTAAPGLFGYRVISKAFGAIDLSDNTVYNVKTGINFIATNSNQMLGTVDANRNTIGLHPNGGSGQYVNNAIVLERGGGLIAMSAITGTVKSDNNTIKDVYNGITHRNFIQPSTCNVNTITLKNNSSGIQTGILHEGSQNDITGTNKVTGFGIISSKATGIQSAGGMKHNIGCNEVLTTYEGFKFTSGVQNFVQWRANKMTGNRESFVLNFSRIGDQLAGGYMSENQWLPSNVGFFTGNKYQAVVYNSSQTIAAYGPAASKLNVANNITNRPDAYNISYPTVTNNIYALGVGIALSFKTTVDVCQPAKGQGNPTGVIHNIIPFGEFQGTENFIAQYDLWCALRTADTLIEDTTGMLDLFYAMGDTCRFGMLSRIDSVLDEGDTALVRSMIDDPNLLVPKTAVHATGITIADTITANRVIDNYRKYYNLYLKYLGGSLNGDDSLRTDSLGSLCVQYDGYAVFLSRTLYDLLYEDMKVFTSECETVGAGEDSIGGRQGWNPYGVQPFSVVAGKGVQQYDLLPNPNNGNFSVRQMVQDELPVDAEVWNAVGARVFKGKLEFKAKKADIRSANLAPGNYLLKLNDSKGQHYIVKFTVL